MSFVSPDKTDARSMAPRAKSRVLDQFVFFFRLIVRIGVLSRAAPIEARPRLEELDVVEQQPDAALARRVVAERAHIGAGDPAGENLRPIEDAVALLVYSAGLFLRPRRDENIARVITLVLAFLLGPVTKRRRQAMRLFRAPLVGDRPLYASLQLPELGGRLGFLVEDEDDRITRLTAQGGGPWLNEVHERGDAGGRQDFFERHVITSFCLTWEDRPEAAWVVH